MSADSPQNALSTDEPPADGIYEILGDERRRLILISLVEYGPLGRRDLAEVVAAKENDKPVEALEKEEFRRVYISLLQVHLPKLAKHQCIIWDRYECEECDACETVHGTDSVNFGVNAHRFLDNLIGLKEEEYPRWLDARKKLSK